jgi:Skp family chaperone for outer membrane proteins
MKQSSRFAVAFVALVAAMVPAAAQQQTPRPAAPAQPAPAQPERAARPLPPKGATIVVIDISVVARDSVAARAMRSQVDRQQAALRTEDEKTDKDLRAAEQELVQQRTILAPDAFNQRRRDFERRVTEAQQASQNKRRDLEEAFGAAQRRIETAVNEIVIEIAKENDYKVVVPRAVVVASHDAVDITDEVLQRLNRKVPSIALALPAAAPAPAPRR